MSWSGASIACLSSSPTCCLRPDLPLACGRSAPIAPPRRPSFPATLHGANARRTSCDKPDPPRVKSGQTGGSRHGGQERDGDQYGYTLLSHARESLPSHRPEVRGRNGGAHHRGPAPGGLAQGGSAAERDFQQRQLLEHRHRREGRHPDLQRRRRADAGLHGRRRDEQDHAGRHFRSATK